MPTPLLFLLSALADDDPLMAAASAELDRVAAALSEQPEPAYWIGLGIVDRTVVDVQATHGAASTVDGYHTRLADIDLRVGSPELDSTHKIRDAGWFSEDPRPSPVSYTHLRAHET